MGLAAAGGKLYASLFYQYQVVIADPEKGVAIGEHSLGAARRAGGGHTRGVRDQRQARDEAGRRRPMDAGRAREPFAPVGLACDGRGNLYVSDWAEAMCVKVFSPDGKLLRTIGKPGGRVLSGKYEPQGMFRPLGIAVDGRSGCGRGERPLAAANQRLGRPRRPIPPRVLRHDLLRLGRGRRSIGSIRGRRS